VDQAGVHHGSFDEVEVAGIAQALQIAQAPGGEIVQGPHLITSGVQRLHQMGADEPRTSCD
jgi:hypothetical protein